MCDCFSSSSSLVKTLRTQMHTRVIVARKDHVHARAVVLVSHSDCKLMLFVSLSLTHTYTRALLIICWFVLFCFCLNFVIFLSVGCFRAPQCTAACASVVCTWLWPNHIDCNYCTWSTGEQTRSELCICG